MRADRLLAVLMLLQRRGRTTAADLAQRLEVSERTIYRDLEALQAAGVPVYCQPGRNGGIRLVEGYRTDLSGLSLGEAELVPLLGLGDAFPDTDLGRALRQAESKLLMAMPEAQRERAEGLRRKIHVDMSAWWHGAELVPHLPALVEAAFTARRVTVSYRRGGDDSVVTRTLDPLGLVLKAGVWYLVAAAGKSETRTYRASRILEAEVTNAEANVPVDFDLAGSWNARRTEFETAGTEYRVVIRARPEAARQLKGAGDGDVPDAEWTRIDLTFGTKSHAMRRLLSFGADVIVEEPAELREAIASCLAEAAGLY
jgi:predicted DNA-binding transcriptional regulator YafY